MIRLYRFLKEMTGYKVLKAICLFTFFCSMMPEEIRAVEETILVCLEGDSERLPLYLTHIDDKNSGFDPKYCAQIEKVLYFDLDNNGMTVLLKSSVEREKLACVSNYEESPKALDWKTLGAFYVVKAKIQNKKMSILVFSANGISSKNIEGIALTGDLNQDRKTIHQVSDKIHYTLFKAKGIASTRILYTIKSCKAKSFISEVWECDYDGYNKKMITSGEGYIVTPIYVPPKQGFSAGTCLFVSYSNGQPKIYTQKLDKTSKPCRLTLLKGNQLMPSMNRQRDKLAFISDITGNPDLFILPFNPDVGATGKPYQIFSTHLATQATPTFSPDGKKIAFVSDKDGSPRIYMMNVEEPGTKLKDIKATLITKRNRESSAPAWSPDGKKIAYCSVIQGVRQIWVYDFDTREERQVTKGKGNKENPSWAPNSLHLVFNSSDSGSCELYLINLNKPESIKITSGEGEKRFPSWEPK